MEHAHAQLTEAQAVLRSFLERKRLTALVNTMAREIERLDDDNAQLRAAVEMYRETVRRYSAKAGYRIR